MTLTLPIQAGKQYVRRDGNVVAARCPQSPQDDSLLLIGLEDEKPFKGEHYAYGFTSAGLLNLLTEVVGESRKQDEALIRQMLDALSCTGESDDPGHRCGHCDDYVDRNGLLRAAARKRLEGGFAPIQETYMASENGQD